MPNRKAPVQDHPDPLDNIDELIARSTAAFAAVDSLLRDRHRLVSEYVALQSHVNTVISDTNKLAHRLRKGLEEARELPPLSVRQTTEPRESE